MKIRNPIMLNPFFWFSIIWTIVLIVHSFSFTYLYPALSNPMLLFFLFVIISSVVLAFVYHAIFLKNRTIEIKKTNTSLFLFIIILLLFILSFLYSGYIPIISVLQGYGQSYSEFGMPQITFIVYTLNTFLSLISSIRVIYGQPTKMNIFYLLFTYFMFLIVYSRGMLLLCIALTFIIYLSKIKIKFKHIILGIILLIVGSLAFNILGNIRQGDAWNDPSSILQIAYFKPKYYFLKHFSWVLVYLDTPLGNLAYNDLNVPPLYDTNGLIAMLLPDIISKRIFPNYNNGLFLPQPGLTVSSFFAGGYKYYGYVGMLLSYLEMILIIIVCSYVSKKNDLMFAATTSLCTVLAIFTFFDNMFTYTGYSLCLFYIVIYLFASWFLHFTNSDILFKRKME